MELKLKKQNLHPRNKHKERYDFPVLINDLPELQKFVFENKYGDQTIDFANPEAIKMLNKALLVHFYDVKNWDIPNNYLCPPIPGRADYIHYAADILAESNNGQIPKGNSIKCLDIGVGANCIYPIIGHREYDWSFVGADIDLVSVKAANAIIDFNEVLKNGIEIRPQSDKNLFFEGIIKENEKFDITFCNPPFYTSAEEAFEKNSRKSQNLTGKKSKESVRNFAGNANELWCDGGELKFIISMIRESKVFSKNCKWFTTLVSKKEHLDRIYKELDKQKVIQSKTIEMAQGQKISRLVAWRF
jgi:23S rRNA (adenine1618-N6)-methyltransferase